MDVLIDYRPALRARTGVGEYMHELLAALSRGSAPDEHFHLFTSSWKDRLAPSASTELPGVTRHDERVPVRLLNWSWHRLGWPPVERLTGGRFDVVQAAHPLLIPTAGAGIVTIHDLDFLDHPERTAAEVRRDYATRVRLHAARADGVVVPSSDTRDRSIDRLRVSADKIVVAHGGPPRWTASGRTRARDPAGHVLFVGTLEPRKNLGALLTAYEMLVQRRPDTPRLKIAGRVTDAARSWIDRTRRPPLSTRVDVLGYVHDTERRALFEDASVLVLPSWHEGFGFPALEAMSMGVPVVAARRGALPEVLGDAGCLVEPDAPDSIAAALAHLLDDPLAADASAARGVARAATFSWDRSADAVRSLYRRVVARRRKAGLKPCGRRG